MAPKIFLFTAFAGAAALSAGCSSPSSSLPVYDSAQTGQVISSQKGEIIAVRDVVIKAPSRHSGSVGPGSQIGAATAAAAVMGSPIAAASAVGSVIGGMAGARADDRMGEEITIAIEGGKSVIVVQERGEPPFAVGERVAILQGANTAVSGGGTSHVVRDPSY